MVVAGQFGDALGQGGHRGQIVAGQVRIRHADADLAFAKKQQLDRAKESMPAWDRELFSSKSAPSDTKLARANSQSCAAIVLGSFSGVIGCVGSAEDAAGYSRKRAGLPPKNPSGIQS